MSPSSRSGYLYCALTNVGRSRSHNEDAVVAQPPIFAVADGLGGHEAGEVASDIAIQKLIAAAPKKPDRGALDRAVRAANHAVLKAVESGKGKSGMGTTMTAAVIGEGRIVLAQVGDSRAYLLRRSRLMQVTEDHSIVAAMVRSGSLTAEQAQRHPQRNVITRALGTEAGMPVDTYEYETLRGDRWLLCSDGLTSMVPNSRIEEILCAEPTPALAAERLIQAANDAGGLDNISVVVIDITEEYIPKSGGGRSTRWWLGVLGWLAAVTAILCLVGWGVTSYASSRAFLQVEPSGNVAIYRGVPGELMGITLSECFERTPTAYVTLSPQDQASISNGATFASVSEARDALASMRERSRATQEFENQ